MSHDGCSHEKVRRQSDGSWLCTACGVPFKPARPDGHDGRCVATRCTNTATHEARTGNARHETWVRRCEAHRAPPALGIQTRPLAAALAGGE